MRKALLLLVAMGLAAASLQFVNGQELYTRRNPDTELFTRHPESTNQGYARVDRFDQLFATHSSPGRAAEQTVPDRWWEQ